MPNDSQEEWAPGKILRIPYEHEILHERESIYGDPHTNFDCAARLITVLLGHPVTAEQVALMLCCVKLARIITGKPHDDNYVDAAAYFELAKLLHVDE